MKLSITDLVKITVVGNEGNVIMIAYGKCKCGLTPAVCLCLQQGLSGGPLRAGRCPVRRDNEGIVSATAPGGTQESRRSVPQLHQGPNHSKTENGASIRTHHDLDHRETCPPDHY